MHRLSDASSGRYLRSVGYKMDLQELRSHHSRPYDAKSYRRRNEHQARTSKDGEDSYILTLLTDKKHHSTMTGLREKYFPPEINKLEAHITLFHALPGSELQRITQDISEIASTTQAFTITARRPFRMSRGVGIQVAGEEPANQIFEQLKQRWEPFLSQQDLRFKAHYTIQNKIGDAQKVEDTLKEVQELFQGSQGEALGLKLYKYDRGFWKREREFLFQAPSQIE